MPISRRAALAALVIGASGCTSSPVVTGAPAEAPTSPPPTQAPEARAAQEAVAGLRGLLTGLIGSAAWPAQPWAVAAGAQCDAHLAVMSLPDPLATTDQEPFAVAVPTPAPPADEKAGVEALTAATGSTVTALEAAAAAASEPEVRLLYASAATATVGLGNRSLAPVEGDGAPTRLQPTTLEASLPIALGHAWALIYGLGVGIGRLGRKDPLHAMGTARLAAAKEARNALREAITGDAPEQPAAFDLPTAMDSPETIREGWGVLEANLLDGYARLVAADPAPAWRVAMRNQVAPTQAATAALPFWPGWTA